MCVFSQDLLGTDWAVPSDCGPADVAAAVSSCALRASSVAHRVPEKICLEQTGERTAAPCDGTTSRSGRHAAAGQTVALGLRRLSSPTLPPSSHPPAQSKTQPVLASLQCHANTQGSVRPCVAQDEFDDWDVDLADLDECDVQMGRQLQPPNPAPPVPTVETAFSTKSLRPPTREGIRPDKTLREPYAVRQPLGSSNENLASQTLTASHLRSSFPRPAVRSAPSQRPGVFPGLTAASPAHSPISRTHIRHQLPQTSWSTPRPTPRAHSLFETVSPAPSSSPSVNSSTLNSHPLHTPVLTNRLVQLVSASSKLPKKRPSSELHRPRTRRFPGPAGLLPQQVSFIQCSFSLFITHLIMLTSV